MREVPDVWLPVSFGSIEVGPRRQLDPFIVKSRSACCLLDTAVDGRSLHLSNPGGEPFPGALQQASPKAP